MTAIIPPKNEKSTAKKLKKADRTDMKNFFQLSDFNSKDASEQQKNAGKKAKDSS